MKKLKIKIGTPPGSPATANAAGSTRLVKWTNKPGPRSKTHRKETTTSSTFPFPASYLSCSTSSTSSPSKSSSGTTKIVAQSPVTLKARDSASAVVSAPPSSVSNVTPESSVEVKEEIDEPSSANQTETNDDENTTGEDNDESFGSNNAEEDQSYEDAETNADADETAVDNDDLESAVAPEDSFDGSESAASYLAHDDEGAEEEGEFLNESYEYYGEGPVDETEGADLDMEHEEDNSSAFEYMDTEEGDEGVTDGNGGNEYTDEDGANTSEYGANVAGYTEENGANASADPEENGANASADQEENGDYASADAEQNGAYASADAEKNGANIPTDADENGGNALADAEQNGANALADDDASPNNDGAEELMHQKMALLQHLPVDENASSEQESIPSVENKDAETEESMDTSTSKEVDET